MQLNQIPEENGNYTYIIPDLDFGIVNEVFIQKHCAEYFNPHTKGFLDIHPESIEINSAVFANLSTDAAHTFIIKEAGSLLLSCTCNSVTQKMCNHQVQGLYNISKRTELRIFFDSALRTAKLKVFAEPYGLHNEPRLEDYFGLEYTNSSLKIKPVSPNLIPVSGENLSKLNDDLINKNRYNPGKSHGDKEAFMVFGEHRYSKHLRIELVEAATTQSGKPKNPVSTIKILDRVWDTDNHVESKFYFGIQQFQNPTTTQKSTEGINALKAVLKNPLQLKKYYQSDLSVNLNANALTEFITGTIIHQAQILIKKEGSFFEIKAEVDLDGEKRFTSDISIKHDYFLEIKGKHHLAGNLNLLEIIDFFKKHDDKILIHQSKYDLFRENFLANLEQQTKIEYSYLPPATKTQLKENNFDEPAKWFIYLKDSDPFVEIDPVMKYGHTEISILSNKQIYPQGIKSAFFVSRDTAAEIAFTSLIIKQHPFFVEQSGDALPYFYLHKKHFLNEDWVLNTFEEWRNHGISILGFNKLKENKLNPHPAKITVRLLSGIDWFNAEIDVRYGKKKASVTQINKAIRNKNKYITLDDGSLGVLPQEWLDKFSEYFSAGDLIDDSLKIRKSNFSVISQLFEDEMIDDQVKTEVQFFNEKLRNFHSIDDVKVPEDLQATLRDYQKQGLNWLNFLDDFNFGGCLADDMGLGKTIQILAFILSMRTKRSHNTNLLVVPTSLIFNWQTEIRNFAPGLNYLILYGSKRNLDLQEFDKYELIITSYGTLISDIRFLKNYNFNYIFLDESQNIKNPDSQRYKAACLLKSRNRIAITGTPVENNTFDLFGQLSFACPGLLGNKQYFKDIYSSPIDTFHDSKREKELQHKIQPFILRRTKSQVVKELPEKTEIVINCEMGFAQQKIYDAFEKEFREYICSKTDDELPKSSIHVLKGLTRLRQICNSPVLLNDDDINEKASAKISVLMEHLISKTSEHKILVFSQFVSMLDLIKKELTSHHIAYSYLSGQTKNRNQVVEEFQNDHSKRVFLISLKAGGVGLNLTQADYVYLVDPWWNPAVENQAIDRIYRIGQKKNVFAIRLICTGTIEEKMMRMQEGKKDLFNNLIQSDEGIGKSFTKSALLSLLNNT